MNDEELGLLAAVIAGIVTLAFAWWCKVEREAETRELWTEAPIDPDGGGH